MYKEAGEHGHLDSVYTRTEHIELVGFPEVTTPLHSVFARVNIDRCRVALGNQRVGYAGK